MPIFSSTITDLASNKMPQPYYRFDGSDDIINLGNISGTFDHATIMSVSAWIKTTATSATIISDESSGGFAGVFFLYVQNDGTILWRRGNGASAEWNFESTKTVNDDQWHHIVAIDSGTALSLYIDGVSNGSAGSGTYASAGASGRDVMIGRLARTASGGFFKGEISNISIYNVALSSSEISEIYAGSSPSWKYLTAGGTISMTNANFEAGDGSTWNTDSGTWSISTTRAHGGTYSVKAHGGTNTYFRKAETITTIIGKRYRASCWVWQSSADANNGRLTVGTSQNGTQYGMGARSETESWVYVYVDFTSTQSTVHIAFKGDNSPSEVYYDDLEIRRIGALAVWDGSGMGEKIWGDKSGNDLHGTVLNGAAVQNAPYDSGTEYENGSWTPNPSGFGGSYDKNGSYFRVGKLITARGWIQATSNHADSSHFIITGLPYVGVSGITGTWGAFLTRGRYGSSSILQITDMFLHKQEGNDRIAGYDAGGDLTYTDVGFDSNQMIGFVVIYECV